MIATSSFSLKDNYRFYSGQHIWNTVTSVEGVLGVKFSSNNVDYFTESCTDETSPLTVRYLSEYINNFNFNKKTYRSIVLLVPYRISTAVHTQGAYGFTDKKDLSRISNINKIAKLSVAYSVKYNMPVTLIVAPVYYNLNVQFDLDEKQCILASENRLAFGCLLPRQQEYLTGSVVYSAHARLMISIEGTIASRDFLEAMATAHRDPVKSIAANCVSVPAAPMAPAFATATAVATSNNDNSNNVVVTIPAPLPVVRKIPIIRKNTNYEHCVLSSYNSYKTATNNGNSNNNQPNSSPVLEEPLSLDFDDVIDVDADNDVTCRKVGSNKYRRLGKSQPIVIDDDDDGHGEPSDKWDKDSYG